MKIIIFEPKIAKPNDLIIRASQFKLQFSIIINFL